MSRRTKLIIAALFLVLLAIPASHIILTWHPENPLRYRITKVHPPIDAGDGWGPMHQVDLEIVNVTNVPVYLFGACMTLSPSSVGPSVYMDGWQLEGLIPAHGVVPGTCTMGLDRIEPAFKGELWIRYNWMSHTQHTAYQWCEKVRRLLPEGLAARVPEMDSFGSDLVPLEPPSPVK